MQIGRILPLILLLSFNAVALNVGSVTTIIAADKQRVAKEIKNETEMARLVTVRVERISSPFSSATVLPFGSPDELLVAPSQLMMPAETRNLVKFYYQGKADAKERYYRITFTDESVGDRLSNRSGKNADAMTRAIISTILVVQPRKKHLDYRFNRGKITNTGNVSWRVTAMGRCLKKNAVREQCRDVFYVPPGETYTFPDVDINDTRSSVGIWDIDQFVPVNKSGAL